jgi:hypothetical protein
MGIVAIALGVGGIAYYAAILHLVLHSLTKAVCFIKWVNRNSIGNLLLDESGDYLRLYPAAQQHFARYYMYCCDSAVWTFYFRIHSFQGNGIKW